VPTRVGYSYVVLRVVPRVERDEFLNAGVVLFCREQRYLDARVGLDEARLRALDAHCDVPMVRAQLSLVAEVIRGRDAFGEMRPVERFRWLAADRSTVIQTSPVHTGLCENAQATLDRLYEQLVRTGHRDAPPGTCDR